jgi:hypothetical protein
MKTMLYAEKVKQIENDLLPFGIINDNMDDDKSNVPQWEVWKG